MERGSCKGFLRLISMFLTLEVSRFDVSNLAGCSLPHIALSITHSPDQHSRVVPS